MCTLAYLISLSHKKPITIDCEIKNGKFRNKSKQKRKQQKKEIPLISDYYNFCLHLMSQSCKTAANETKALMILQLQHITPIAPITLSIA